MMIKSLHSLPIFVRIIIATIVPLVFIFSLVLGAIAKLTFEANAEDAQEKIFFEAKQSADQLQVNSIHTSRLMKLAAYGLTSIVGDSDSARDAALTFVENIFEDTTSVLRIWLYFEPGEDKFGNDGIFAHELFRENGLMIRRPLLNPDLSLPQFAVPLEEGRPYHRTQMTKNEFKQNEGMKYIITTNYPVTRDGVVIGCVGMELLYQNSFASTDEWGGDQSFRFLIREECGTILYAPDYSLIGRKFDELGFEADFFASMKKAMRQGKHFLEEGYSPVSGSKSLICLYPIKMRPGLSLLYMYVGTPTKVVYHDATAAARTMFLIVLVGLLIFTASLFVMARNIVKPIKKLTESADLIANGQLDASFKQFDTIDEKHKTGNEVYLLECSLQKMLKELKNSHKLKIMAMEAEREKTKIEESAAAKNRFFANMSHEIRTPMNVILGMSEILMTENLTKDQKKFVHDIKISSESLLNIINDILDLSRLESGKLSLLPVHYDFCLLVENIESLSKYLARKKRLGFNVKTTGSTPKYLYGDDGRLRQVLLNIIGNAIKFTNEGYVTLDIIDEGEMLRFDIIDSGIGILKQDMKYLFERFKQIDGAQTLNAKGTGLGLSICLNLVELMGGSITVESEFGQGSSFQVRIPKVLGDGIKIENKPGILPFSFDPRSQVLVVDDSKSNLKVAVEFLKLFGITADTASSGAEAISMVSASDYDLILMDHMMPEMDGVETSQRIRDLGERQMKVTIVALTANAVIGTREMLLASGINDFLAKPIEKLKFQAVLAKWLPDDLVISHAPNVSLKADRREGKSKSLSAVNIIANVSETKKLDISLGLSRVAGNMDLYIDLLGMMVEMIPNTLKKVDEALSDGVEGNLSFEMHTLKGSLANLGAVELAAKAAELELLGKQGDFDLFAEKLKAFRLELCDFADELQKELSLEEEEEQLNMHGGRQALEDALRQLRTTLDDFDHEKSIGIISSLAGCDWGEPVNMSLKTVWTHIKHFDYDSAIIELDRKFPEAE